MSTVQEVSAFIVDGCRGGRLRYPGRRPKSKEGLGWLGVVGSWCLWGAALHPEHRTVGGSDGVSIHLLTILERLELLVFRASMAMSCGLLVLITAREGKSGRAWLWSLAFVGTSLLTDLLFWRLT